MKIKGIFLVSLFGLILINVIFFNFIGPRAGLCNGVSGEKIKQVRLGMTLEQVIGILGRPFSMTSTRGLHNNNCKNPKPYLNLEINDQTEIRKVVDEIYNDTNYCCEGNKQDLQDKFVTLAYSKPIWFAKYYPMLWIHFDKNYRVNNVYAKQYDGFLGFDDPCIYDDRVIDQEKFANCFQ